VGVRWFGVERSVQLIVELAQLGQGLVNFPFAALVLLLGSLRIEAEHSKLGIISGTSRMRLAWTCLGSTSILQAKMTCCVMLSNTILGNAADEAHHQANIAQGIIQLVMAQSVMKLPCRRLGTGTQSGCRSWEDARDAWGYTEIGHVICSLKQKRAACAGQAALCGWVWFTERP